MEQKELTERKGGTHRLKPHEKHHEKGKGKKEHQSGVGASITGNPDELIKRILPNHADQSTAIEEVINGGPEHKQLYSAILLKRTYALVSAIEEKTGSEFFVREGHLIRSGKPHHPETLPIPFPAASCPKNEMERVLEIISNAPAHEQLLFNTVLQSIEWAREAVSVEGN